MSHNPVWSANVNSAKHMRVCNTTEATTRTEKRCVVKCVETYCVATRHCTAEIIVRKFRLSFTYAAKRQTSLRAEALDLSGTPLIRAQASISTEENTPV